MTRMMHRTGTEEDAAIVAAFATWMVASDHVEAALPAVTWLDAAKTAA